MTLPERKTFLMGQGLSDKEAEEIANEFFDNATEKDLTILTTFDNKTELAQHYIDNVVGTLDPHIAAVLDLGTLGDDLLDTCDEYMRCNWSGRIIELSL